MRSDRTEATGAKAVTMGRIVVTGSGGGPVDGRYLAWMQAAVSARMFAERVLIAGSDYELRRCRLETVSSSDRSAELELRVDILPLGSLADLNAGSLSEALDRVAHWVETALATLIENTSVGEPEAELPARLEIRFEDHLAKVFAGAVAPAPPGEDHR